MNKLFYSYIVVGGMPKAVQTYVDTHDIGRVILEQQSILEQYRLDVSQYAEGNDSVRIRDIFDNIPAQLNEKNRRFYISSIDRNARMNRYENSFKWLDDAGVALPCYNVSAPQVPLKLNAKHSLFRLYMNDTGLLCAACMDNIQLDLLSGRLDVNMGSILENMFAQQLKSAGFSLYYYDSVSHGEADFVIQSGMHTDLIEVKSGTDYRKHKAMDSILAVDEWEFRNAWVFCRDNLSVDGRILYLPWYMVMFFTPPKAPLGTTYDPDLSGLEI